MAEVKPHASIRRFDVFAEYSRLKGLREEDMSASKAKGYGLWLAKVVAAKKFGRLPKSRGEKKEPRPPTKWHELSGIPQTDKLFDEQIIDRMGKTFYARIFAPAIKKAYEHGESYEQIRDKIRREWKP
jgi:hypothetical protein